MKKVIRILLLVAFCDSALAGWTEVPIAGNNKLYVDKATIQKSGNIVKLTWLNDLAQPVPSRRKRTIKYYYSSKIFQAEYDCSNENYRIVYLSLHTGKMGNGVEYNGQASRDWRHIKDGHEEWRQTWAIACRNR